MSPSGSRDAYVPTRAAARAAWTAGGMLATAEDLARAADGILRGDLISPAARKEMTRFKPTGQVEFDYGVGIGRLLLGDEPVWAHGGDCLGFHADVAYMPEDHVTVVALNNHQRNAPAQDALIDSLVSDVSASLADK